MEPMRITYHNGRSGSAKHNDRTFNLDKAEHIDQHQTENNRYYTWLDLIDDTTERSFEEAEEIFYERHFGKGLTARNDRYLKNRHPERVKSMKEYMKRILTPDPFEDADLRMSYAHCKDSKKPTEQVVMTADGVRKLLSVVYDHESRDETYMPDYAIELSCFTGMRVGELAGLKWSSVRTDGIHIDHSEHRYDYEDKPSEYLIGEPKNDKHRVFPMTDEMMELFHRIRSVQKKHGIESEFVFEGTEGRYTARKIGQAMARRCSKAGLSCKCIHGMRKTVSSHLRTKLPIATVAELMGHLPETNENFYNFDITEMDYKKNKVSEMWTESFKPHEAGISGKM